jgi:D-galactarolactone cycloisomerase
MKIDKIHTHLLCCSLEQPMGSSAGHYDTRQALLVKIETDDGLVGWGEAAGLPAAASAVIDAALRPILIGRDPADINVLWHEMYIKTRHYGQKGVAIAAISAIDIALWDILGHALGVPIYRLLGGAFGVEVEAYAMGLYYYPGETLDDLQTRAARLVNEDHFRGVKMKIGGLPLREDIRRVAAVREALGAETLLMVDANGAYNASAAIMVGRTLAEHGVFWFEEPVPPEDIAGYCEVKRALPMLIAGGECEYTYFGFRRLLGARAVDVVQPETCAAGGITECRRISDLAHADGVFYVPHMHGSALALAVNLQLVAAMPPVSSTAGPHPPQMELDASKNPLREDLLVQPLEPCAGVLRVPEGPGLGVRVNESAVREYEARSQSRAF